MSITYVMDTEFCRDVDRAIEKEAGRPSISSVKTDLHEAGWRRLGGTEKFADTLRSYGYRVTISRASTGRPYQHVTRRAT